MSSETPRHRAGDLALDGRLSINEFMLVESTFEQDLESCKRAGAAGMGIWEARLGSGRDPERAEQLAASGLRASVCVPEAPSILPLTFFEDSYDAEERIDALVTSIRRFAPFRPSSFLTITGVEASLDVAEQRRIVVDGYRRAGDAAAEIGATITIEPMRNRPDDSLVRTIAEAADLVTEIGHDAVGIMYDVWHHWDSPTVLEDIATYVSLFAAVQVGDWPDRPNEGIDREIPGEGVVELDRLFAALEAAGFTGWYDLELVADPEPEHSLLRLDRAEMLERSRMGLQAAWDRAGLSNTPRP